MTAPTVWWRPLRFAMAGVVNTGVSYGIYVALVAGGMALPWAGLLSLASGIVTGFLTQGRFVFGQLSWSSARRYVLAWGALYLVHLGIVWSLQRWGVSPYLGALVALGALTALSYGVLRHFVFAPAGQTKSR